VTFAPETPGRPASRAGDLDEQTDREPRKEPTMILVAYASKHGSTQGIAEHITRRLTERGLPVEIRPAEGVVDIGVPDAVILGSAVYAGSWMKEASEFARRFTDVLSAVPVWLFSSGPLGERVDDDEEQPRQLAEFRETVRPRGHEMFFGALDLGQLSFGERMIAKAVKAPEGDFRDWDAIAAWADSIADELATIDA
jgi:menaquinone-dependent protoporphyrinogen oxidase